MRETRSSGSVEGVVGNHDPYSDFLPRFSRGIKEASDSLLASAKGCLFVGEPRHFGFAFRSSLVTCHLSLVTALQFLGGTANPQGVRQRTDKAEARRAASAQAVFPSRRAREKAVPEKGQRVRKTQAGQHEKDTRFKGVAQS